MRLEAYLISPDHLNEIEIFRYASNTELELLRNASIIKSFPKGKIVINENELPSHVFFILTGSCHVQLNGRSGKEIIIKDLYEGDCFGELGAYTNAKRCASVVANSDSTFIIINANVYASYCNNNIRAAQITINRLAKSLSKITKDYQSLAMDNLTHRLVRILFEVSKKDKNKLYVNLTHNQLANRASTTRESVSRVISELRKNGFIHINDHEIELDNTLIEIHSQL